jgi:class 3 adenylate cyclase
MKQNRRLVSCLELHQLLDQRNAQPRRRKQVDEMIRTRFEVTCAILILDMSGFSVSVQRHGIIHHLGSIRRMHVAVKPAVESIGGRVVKFDADNCFAVFDTVNLAVQGVKAIEASIRKQNSVLPEKERIAVSMGIGYGAILLGTDDLFGDQVNQAAKLGEDLAGSDEVLLTEAAGKKLTLRGVKRKTIEFSISGLSLRAVKLEGWTR